MKSYIPSDIERLTKELYDKERKIISLTNWLWIVAIVIHVWTAFWTFVLLNY